MRDTELHDPSHSPTHAPALQLKKVDLVRSGRPPEVDGAEAPAPSVEGYIDCVIDGRYKIQSLLGRGGMGVVYAARHEVLGKQVAIKILLPTEDTEVVARFVMEAQAASSIGNAHIVDTLDFGLLPDGSTYFVMEYLQGQTLSRVIAAADALPTPRVLHLASQIAEGMAAAHAAGIVHRDLKPDNIYITTRDGQPDFVKLLDFGIAKVASAQNKLTRAGKIFGTPHYMSPEQCAGQNVDHRADIYSLGVILYEMASGRVPFDAENPMGLLTQHMYSEPVPLSKLEPPPSQPVDPGLEAVVFRCLAKSPDERYSTMQALLEELRRLREGIAPEAIAMGPPTPAARPTASALPIVSSSPFGADVASPRSWRRVVVGVGLSLAGAAVAVVALRATGLLGAPAPVGIEAGASVVSESADAGIEVALVFSPIDAEVFQNGKSLGGMPVSIRIPPGGSVEVEVRREGFFSERVKLDGTERVVVKELREVPGVAHAIPVPASRPDLFARLMKNPRDTQATLALLKKEVDEARETRRSDAGAAPHRDAGPTAPPTPAPASGAGTPPGGNPKPAEAPQEPGSAAAPEEPPPEDKTPSTTTPTEQPKQEEPAAPATPPAPAPQPAPSPRPVPIVPALSE